MVSSFNRPQAIRCLATRIAGLPDEIRMIGFNRPQAIRCLATNRASDESAETNSVSIARRRFVVLRQATGSHRPARGIAFQSPAGDSLSCDVEADKAFTYNPTLVSIARRRFVVLRPASAVQIPPTGKGGFNRPQAIRCLATQVFVGRIETYIVFQSPAGDSLSCDTVTVLRLP